MEKLEFKKELPVSRNVDVAVIGAGPAGIAASISAARNGAKVLVFDQWGGVGGMATLGMVSPFMSCFDSTNKIQIIRGIFEEMVERLCADGNAIHPSKISGECSYSSYFKLGHNRVGPFNSEAMKSVAADMILESGADLLLHTTFSDVLVDNGHINGIVISNKQGLSVVRAKEYIDCTGDGDVAARAGAEYRLGGYNGEIQGATLNFHVGNVNTAELDAHIAKHSNEIRPFYGPLSWLIKEKTDEWKGINRQEVCMFELPQKGEFNMNVTRVLNVDPTKTEDLTRAELEGEKQAIHAFKFIKKYVPGFENAIYMGSAPVIGIRESRHIKGIKTITGNDVKSCNAPEDTIAVMATNMDTHGSNDNGGSFYVVNNGPYYGVPYGCLVPYSLDNLLVAGRSISADEVASSSIRMIPCCFAFGQAAGTAAAYAVANDIIPKNIDVTTLRETLRSQDVYLG